MGFILGLFPSRNHRQSNSLLLSWNAGILWCVAIITKDSILLYLASHEQVYSQTASSEPQEFLCQVDMLFIRIHTDPQAV